MKIEGTEKNDTDTNNMTEIKTNDVSPEPRFTGADVVAAVRAVVAERPDHRYAKPLLEVDDDEDYPQASYIDPDTGASYINPDTGECSCVFGHAFKRLGIPMETIKWLDGATSDLRGYGEPEPVAVAQIPWARLGVTHVPPMQSAWMSVVQNCQDPVPGATLAHYTWAQAVAMADEVYPFLD